MIIKGHFNYRKAIKITFQNDGGGRRIRTFEGSAGRFTICSLWPLGNPTTGCCYKLVEAIVIKAHFNYRKAIKTTFQNDGGGRRIRTFEGSAGRFTICSLWPLGNPTTGCCYKLVEAMIIKGHFNYRKVIKTTFQNNGGGRRIRTFEGSAGRFTICSLWPLGNPTTGCCYKLVEAMMIKGHFNHRKAVIKQLFKINGGGGRIRTFEGSAGRFTICSLWPLGNPTTSAGRIITNISAL